MTELVTYRIDDAVAILTIDNPPVNALSSAVVTALQLALQRAVTEKQVKAVVVAAAGSTFVAGADIREFGEIVAGKRPQLDLYPFLQAIEDCPKPVVMALHGTTLGGGLELAMAGHYRVMHSQGTVGLPEVKLGLIPGAGGTQRLPRLAGVVHALLICTSGESISATNALNFGIVDRIVDSDLLANAVDHARRVAQDAIPKPSKMPIDPSQAHADIFERLRESIRNPSLESPFAQFGPPPKKPDAPPRALLAVIDAIEAATQLPFDQGCRREAELFRQCLESSESKALIHVFFGERAVAKIPGISQEIKPLRIARAAIIGAGTMGAGIAMNYANAGIPVRLKDTTLEALEKGMAAIRKNYASAVAKGRLTPQAEQARISLITPQLNNDGFDEVDIMTEAVFENMALKKQIFAEMDAVARPGCLLATNTSSLNIDELAAVTKRSEAVVGTHFFSPANVMKLLEVVRGSHTAQQTLVSAMALGKRLGKVAVLAGNCFGFIGNRMVDKYLRQAYFLVEEGASVEQVNNALQSFGMAMGPLAMDDLAGIDVGHFIRQESAHLQSPDERQPIVPALLYKLQRYGQKTGRGWSLYNAARQSSPDPELPALIQTAARERGIHRRKVEDSEIVSRCIGALVEEGKKILQEGIALRAVDIDIVYVYGYGFPAWRGGPMFYAGVRD